MPLNYLDFDCSEGSDGNTAWDAMASVPAGAAAKPSWNMTGAILRSALPF